MLQSKFHFTFFYLPTLMSGSAASHLVHYSDLLWQTDFYTVHFFLLVFLTNSLSDFLKPSSLLTPLLASFPHHIRPVFKTWIAALLFFLCCPAHCLSIFFLGPWLFHIFFILMSSLMLSSCQNKISCLLAAHTSPVSVFLLYLS